MADAPSPTDWQNGPTFGVEIECLGVFIEDWLPGPGVLGGGRPIPVYRLASNPKIEEKIPALTVARCLEEFMADPGLIPGKPEFSKTVGAGTPFEGDESETLDCSRWNVTTDNSVRPSCEQCEEAEELGTFSGFEQCGDHAVSEWLRNQPAMAPEEDGYNNICFGSIEIISPVLPATAEGFEAVRKIYRFLNESSFVVNTTAGMHVHVANQKFYGPRSDISYPKLLNLTRWAMCAEFQMCKLQPAHRVLKESYNYFRTRYSLESSQMTTRRIYDAIGEAKTAYRLCGHYGMKFHVIKLVNAVTSETSTIDDPESDIEESDDDDESDSMLSMVHSLSHPDLESRITNLAHSDTDSKAEVKARSLARTIEFRMGEATLSADRTLTWINFVTSLHRRVQESAKPWVFLADYHKDISVEDILTDIGLPGVHW